MNTETLDSLKGVWNDIGKSDAGKNIDLHTELASRWKDRNKKIRFKFILEMVLSILIYITAIIILIQAPASTPSKMFGLKVVLLSLVFFVPVTYSLYQSIMSLKTIDFTQPLKTYVHDSIEKLRRTMRLYVRYGYLSAAFTVVMLVTDDFFSEQTLTIKAITFGFIALMMLLVRPYLKASYGRDLHHFEQIKNEMGDTN
jgi:hypothetical protein